MKGQIIVLVLVSWNAANVLFVGLSWAGQKAVALEKKLPVGAGSVRAANHELEQAVRINLDSNDELPAARLGVSADVTRNQVTLCGSAASSTLREKAIKSARGAQVGVIVNDRIEVRRNATKLAAAP